MSKQPGFMGSVRRVARRIVLVCAAGLVAASVAAGPAAAHDSSEPPGAVMTSSGTGPGANGQSSALVPGMAPADGLGAGSMTFRWMGLLAIGALTVVGALALRWVVPQFWPGVAFRRRDLVAATALLFAGVGHCTVVAEHWAEGWHLGAFFVVSTAVLLGQAVLVYVRPSAAAYRSVVASTLVFLVLYVVAREASLPLVGHRDPYLFEEYPVKVAEGLAAAVAGVALLRTRVDVSWGAGLRVGR